LCSHIFIIHNDHTYITGDYTKLCLNIICNRNLKPRVESFWGVLSCCLTPSILFNFRYKKIKTYGSHFDGALPRLFTEMKMSWKNIFKRGYEEIRDRKLLEILKKDRTWLKYELYCNVKTPAPLGPVKMWAIGFYFFIPEVKQYGRS
jgi:hypothetical protein